MNRIGIAGMALASLLMVGCLKNELTPEEKQLVTSLNAELAAVDGEIGKAQAEDDALTGGLVKVLIGARLEVLKTNRALIQQRIHAVESGAPVKQVTEIAHEDPELAAKLEAELTQARADLAVSEREALGYGGLVGAMKAARAATEGQTVAMLQQRYLAAKYGIAVPAPTEPKSPSARHSEEPFAAASKDDLALCVATSDADRLDCYDALADRLGVKERSPKPTTPDPTPTVGDWIVSTNTDPLTDGEVHTAMLIAKSGRSRRSEPPILTIRCSDSRTEMYIAWNDYLGSDAYTSYRVDKEKASTSNWSLSTDKQAAFFPGSPVSVLKKIADSKSFVASITPYNENPVTAVFDTTGAAEAFSGIRKACNW